MAERLQKILSQWGIASRRQAEQLIQDGRVMVNGEPGHLGQKADPQRDQIAVDGQLLQADAPTLVYLMLNKPFGVVCTCDDPEGRATVLSLIDDRDRADGLHPVGRLDIDSTGILLLTNDGALTFGLTHPRHSIPKTYQVWVTGHPSPATLRQWRQGVDLAGKRTRPAAVQVLKSAPDRTFLQVVLKEGRNRQIRRVAEQLGHPVLRLHRLSLGPVQLGDLPIGGYRSLTEAEVATLQAQLADPAMRPQFPCVQL